MKADSKLAKKIETGDFIVTAECAPGATAASCHRRSGLEIPRRQTGGRQPGRQLAWRGDVIRGRGRGGLKLGVEPVLQMVTRDRNRIALQSDLLGAASLGIKNVLCLSGYHQTLIGCPESANVFDIDSTQFIELTTRMSEQGVLADGTKIDGQFSMLVGAVANPFLKPLELNLFRLGKKIEAGARFIQTHAVFDLEAFSQWLDAVRKEGFTKKAAILAGVFPWKARRKPKSSATLTPNFAFRTKSLNGSKKAGDGAAQKKEGLAICVETIKQLKALEGLRGIHILSGGKEAVVPEMIAAAGL